MQHNRQRKGALSKKLCALAIPYTAVTSNAQTSHPPRGGGGPELEEGVKLVNQVLHMRVVCDGQPKQPLTCVEQLCVGVCFAQAGVQTFDLAHREVCNGLQESHERTMTRDAHTGTGAQAGSRRACAFAPGLHDPVKKCFQACTGWSTAQNTAEHSCMP